MACPTSMSISSKTSSFEYDKLIRSIYTLRYLLNPKLQRNVHRSQNRIESYHQLCAAIAQVGGKKELTRQTNSRFGNKQSVRTLSSQRDYLL